MPLKTADETRVRYWPSLVLRLLLAAILALLCWKFYQVALTKILVIDEFGYSHGSWQVARGGLPYRDFFTSHQPLSYFLFSLPWRFVTDDPLNVLVLRRFVLLFASVSFILLWLLTNRSWLGILAVIFLLSSPPFIQHGVEIRRDNIGLPFFLLSVFFLGRSRSGPVLRGVLSGLFYALLLFTNEKAAVYAVPIPALALVALLNPRGVVARTSADPRAFFGAVISAIIAMVGFGAVWGLGDWIQMAVIFAFKHEVLYPPVRWETSINDLLFRNWWLIPPAIVAFSQAASSLRKEEIDSGELLLLLLLPATFLSFVFQAGPFPYSLMPFQLFLSLYAARGTISLSSNLMQLARANDNIKVLAITLICFVVPFSISIAKQFNDRTAQVNSYQFEVLSTVGKLTAPGDPVFDTSGSSVSRPNHSRFYSTDVVLRSFFGLQIENEILTGFKERGALLLLYDARIDGLPEPVRKYILENFVPYSPDIGIYGHLFRTTAGESADSFYAPADGKYFISVTTGNLEIDGELISGEIFQLKRGLHNIRYRGGASEFSIVWLPRDGNRFTPQKRFAPKFSVIL